MQLLNVIILFFFLFISILLSLYGYLNFREIALAKNDLGLALPQRVERILRLTLIFSFFSSGMLIVLLVLEIVNFGK